MHVKRLDHLVITTQDLCFIVDGNLVELSTYEAK